MEITLILMLIKLILIGNCNITEYKDLYYI